MLHYQTIDAGTLELLRKLQGSSGFENLRLVGGTGLALQYGHRKSVDIDLFGNITIDGIEMAKKLNQTGTAIQLKKSENINIYLLDNIKVDIVNYPYPWLNEPVNEDGLVLAHKEDIAAMKLSAITGRGSKKDFIDLYFLLQEYKLQQLLSFYQLKYHDGSMFLVIKSLGYFDDADSDEFPVMLEPTNWETVKDTITAALNDYLTHQALA